MARSYEHEMLSLWRRTPKRRIHVKGVCIPYLALPPSKVLVWDGEKMVQVPAFSLLHGPTNTGMVFVANTEPLWRMRYTVFHEWHETRSQMGGEERANKKTLRDMFRTIDKLGVSHPELPIRFYDSLQLRCNPVHLAALAAELWLAKREMSSTQFLEFLQEAYTSNRF